MFRAYWDSSEHNREIFGALPKSTIGNFKSIMGSGLEYGIAE